LSSNSVPKNIKIRIYVTIILPAVLYWCETWSLTLWDERRLRLFENRVLRKMLGPKRYDATGEWGRLHNNELCDPYSSPNIMRMIKSRRMRWAGHVARMGRGEVHTGFWWGKLGERDHFADLGVDGRVILKLMCKK
jgi:hypothetical protein